MAGTLICVSTWPAVWTPLNKILHVIQKCGKHYTTREYEIQQKCQVFLEKAIYCGDNIFRGEIIFGEKPFLGKSPSWGEAIFGEKPFSGRSHFRGEAIFGGEAIFWGEAILGRSHLLGRSHFWREAIKKKKKKKFHLTPLLSPLCTALVWCTFPGLSVWAGIFISLSFQS